MVQPVTGLSIPMPILRLKFIPNLIFIHLTIETYDIPSHNPSNSIMGNSVYIFLHITLDKSISTADLSPNFSECNYIYLNCKWYMFCSDSPNSLFWESLSRLKIKIHVTLLSSSWQSSIAYKSPSWYSREMVLQNYPSLIL